MNSDANITIPIDIIPVVSGNFSENIKILLLIYLLVRTDGHRRSNNWHRGGFRFSVSAEICINKVAIALHITQRFPHNITLREETLVCN